MTPLLIYLRLLVMVVMRSIVPEGWMKRGRSLQDNARYLNVKGSTESLSLLGGEYDSLSDVGEIRVYQRADFQSGSRVLKKVF